MPKQICCNSYTLEDPIVLEGIRAIEQIKHEKNIRGHIAGGMGVQSYTPKEFHRKTIDLDFSMLWTGNPEEYRNLTAPLKSFFEEKGYNIELKKKHATYDYLISKDDSSFIIQHRKESKNYFDRIVQKNLEREIRNQRQIFNGDLTYKVLSPEDLAIHKLNRAGIFTERYGIKKPTFTSLLDLYKEIRGLRKELISNFDDINPEDIVQLRLLCDLFDVKCLGEYATFNRDYLTEVIGDYVLNLNINPLEIYKDLDNLQISPK